MIETELLHYGYLFVFFGTIIEGDATLLAAAFLAHRGYFQLSWVLIIAGSTTVVASQLYFLAARRAGARWLESSGVATGPKFERILNWSRRHGRMLLIASRFMIGFRTLIPVVCGAAGMTPARFALWNSIGAVLWVLVFGFGGYLGGHVLTVLIDDIRRHERAVAVTLALGIAGLILWRTHGRELLDAWSLRRTFGSQGR